tara:strand:- start:512 stop:1318 length:807 start_codon:yes stop_codon:yes gene_type:complete
LKFTYYDQTVDLLPKKYFSLWPRIVISVSGGLDSAALLFLLCKYFPTIEKHIFTGDDVNHPIDAFNAENVVNYIKKQIPDHNIKSHDFIQFNDRHPEILKEVASLVKEQPQKYKDKFPFIKRSQDGRQEKHKYTDEEMFYAKIAKPLLNGRNAFGLMKKYNCEVYLSGMTMNPPNSEMKRLGFFNLSELQRNEDRVSEEMIFGKINFKPFYLVNKLFVKGVFEHHGILEEIYPLTGSCTGGPTVTKLWTEPCKKCFWCHERKWAFGKY